MLEKIRQSAIDFLNSLQIPESEMTEERILLAMFLQTNPSTEQIYICTTLVLNARNSNKDN